MYTKQNTKQKNNNDNKTRVYQNTTKTNNNKQNTNNL